MMGSMFMGKTGGSVSGEEFTFLNSQTTMTMKPWIETSLGDKFWYTSEGVEGIEPEAIAHSLANICRYSGHSRFFYSVAEHSVNVARLLPRHKRLWGLLHDAGEAFLMDIPSPAKQLLPDYKYLEGQIMSRIAKRFNLPDLFWRDEEIKRCDWAQLKEEAAVLLPSGGKEWFFPPDLVEGTPPVGLFPANAKHYFMEAYKLLKW